MTSQQQADLNKETYGTAVSGNNPGGSPQHEPRFFSKRYEYNIVIFFLMEYFLFISYNFSKIYLNI